MQKARSALSSPPPKYNEFWGASYAILGLGLLHILKNEGGTGTFGNHLFSTRLIQFLQFPVSAELPFSYFKNVGKNEEKPHEPYLSHIAAVA